MNIDEETVVSPVDSEIFLELSIKHVCGILNLRRYRLFCIVAFQFHMKHL